MLLQILPHGQRESTRCKISERIAELEYKLVPGLKASTAQMIRDQIWQLEQQLKPADDKRNPAHYRRKPPHTESWPVRKWNRDDWLTACWAAGKRSQGQCELCASAPSDMYRLVSYPENHQMKADHVEAVCGPCAARFPRDEVCPYGQV